MIRWNIYKRVNHINKKGKVSKNLLWSLNILSHNLHEILYLWNTIFEYLKQRVIHNRGHLNDTNPRSLIVTVPNDILGTDSLTRLYKYSYISEIFMNIWFITIDTRQKDRSKCTAIQPNANKSV